MAKALSTFYSLVLPHVEGCPSPLLDQALLYSAMLFCRGTGVSQDIATQSIVASQTDYDIDVPIDMRLSAVIGVWVGDAELEPASLDEIHSGVALRGDVGPYTSQKRTPTAFFQKDLQVAAITLFPTPADAGTDYLAIRACYEPSTTATTLPDILSDYYAHDVAAGAIAYLMRLPGQAFSNPTLAADFSQRFNTAISKVKATARTGRIRRSVRVALRAFK